MDRTNSPDVCDPCGQPPLPLPVPATDSAAVEQLAERHAHPVFSMGPVAHRADDPHGAHAHLDLTHPKNASLATESAFKQHHGRTFSYALSLTDRDHANDLAAGAFLSFHLHALRGAFCADEGCPACQGRGWLVRVVRNGFIDDLRKACTRRRAFDEIVASIDGSSVDAASQPGVLPAPDVHESLMNDMNFLFREWELTSLRATLPPRLQDTLDAMLVTESLDCVLVAGVLGISAEGASRLLYRLRLELRPWLSDRGYGPGAVRRERHVA